MLHMTAINELQFGKLLTNINPKNSTINQTDKLSLCEKCSIVENFFQKFKQIKRCQLRYDKHIKTFNGFVIFCKNFFVCL